MELIYTDHLINRLNLRKIDFDLPKAIYQQAEEILYDTKTRHFIAFAHKNYLGKRRLLAVAFDKLSDKVELITIHPILEEDKKQRVSSGRWIKRK